MPKIKNLRASITNGSAPLTVGFVLEGPTIADRKRWNVDEIKYEANDLVYTTTLWEPGDHIVWVDLIDEQSNVIESGKDKRVLIHLTDKLQNIAFDQWQGVIYEGDIVGFSVSTSIQGTPKITWVWGNGRIDSTDDPKFRPNASNPWYKYKTKVEPYKGTVTVSGNGISESKEFAVIVLPNPITGVGNIYASSLHCPIGTEVFTVVEDVTLIAQVSGAKNDQTPYVWLIKNFHGINDSPKGDVGVKITHRFSKSDNYNVQCVVRFDDGPQQIKLILLKDIIIRYDKT